MALTLIAPAYQKKAGGHKGGHKTMYKNIKKKKKTTIVHQNLPKYQNRSYKI